MRFVFELESDLNVTKTQREVNLLNIKYDKRVKVEQLYTMAVTFVDFFSSSLLTNQSFQTGFAHSSSNFTGAILSD